jgi:hypothetical protein
MRQAPENFQCALRTSSAIAVKNFTDRNRAANGHLGAPSSAVLTDMPGASSPPAP